MAHASDLIFWFGISVGGVGGLLLGFLLGSWARHRKGRNW